MSSDPTQQPPVQQHPNPQYPNLPFPGQPQPPLAPAPRRSFFARHKVLTVFLAIIALVVVVSIASSLGGDEPAGTTGSEGTAGTGGAAPEEESDGQAAAPEEAAPGIGTAVRDGKFEFTVTAVEPGVANVGDEFLSVDAQGQFVLVHVTVTNIGDAAQMFDASSQKLLDTQGREHSADSTAGIYLGDANSFLNDINPGNSIQGIVVFDVPADAVPASIELHDSFMSGGISVALG